MIHKNNMQMTPWAYEKNAQQLENCKFKNHRDTISHLSDW